MVIIAIGAVCQRCKKFSPGLYKCKSCGGRFCPLCVDDATGICKFCQAKLSDKK